MRISSKAAWGAAVKGTIGYHVGNDRLYQVSRVRLQQNNVNSSLKGYFLAPIGVENNQLRRCQLGISQRLAWSYLGIRGTQFPWQLVGC